MKGIKKNIKDDFKILVSKRSVYAFMTILLILVLYHINRIEVNVLVFCVGIVCFNKTRYSKPLMKILYPLVILFSIGLLSSLFSSSNFFDTFKDTVYFLKPIVAIVFGYLLFSLLKGVVLGYRVIVLLGLLFSLMHIYNVFALTDFNKANIHNIRANGGLNNFIEMVSILILIVLGKNKLNIFPNTIRNVIISILSISFILYFSRTMLIALGIMYVFSMGYHKLSAKGLIILSSVFVSVSLFYWYLFSTKLSINATGVEAFLYKMRMAPAELFISSEFNLDDKRYLYDHWRGYEASMALNQLKGLNIVFGNGFGALVDLGITIDLGGTYFRYIPILHNGYIYVLFKTGIIGLFFYIVFFLNLFLKFNKKYNDVSLNSISSIVLALVIFFALSSFVISGIYNQSDLIALLFGGFLALQSKILTENQKVFKNSK